MRQFAAGAAVLALLAAGCGDSRAPTPGDGGPAAVLESVREALRTDRIRGATLDGSRLTVHLRPESAPGEAAISLWYGKLFVQEVVNRLTRPVTEAVYTGTTANGGADRRLARSTPAAPLPARACLDAVVRFPGPPVAVKRIGVLGGACIFIVEPDNAAAFVSDAGSAVSGLRDLPGGPNAHPTLIEVIERGGGRLRFVLSWIPAFGGSIGQGSAWVQPGWQSSAIVGVAHVETIP